MYTHPTQAERDAFLWMQGRLVELLLRHDEGRFGGTFGERSADPEPGHLWLEQYRELAVLFYLRDELFDSILPRIKRRLSFESPRELREEEPPTRGRIDWGRTAAATWRERPGEVPLQVVTRQRRRYFDTPENLLTVCTLLEYRGTVHQLLDREATHDSVQAMRHPLNEIIDACTRQLTFPQFAGLTPTCEEVVSGHATQSIEDLEAHVAEHLAPGRNSAYDGLLEWRRRLRALRLLDRTLQLELQPMLGADPDRDNYLYQVWLFYELGELLQRLGHLGWWDRRSMVMTFTWGEDGDAREYRLQHDRGIQNRWLNAPGVRPDLYIERTDRREVREGDQLIWREPGYVLDAKYYRPHDSPRAPGNPVKRMIADLQLTDERHGSLLFAFLGEPPETAGDGEEPAESAPQAPLYTVLPESRAQLVQPDVRVQVRQVRPGAETTAEQAHVILSRVLDSVHRALKDRVEVRCRGVFLDSLTATAHGTLVAADALLQRSGEPFSTDSSQDLLLCPKPHVAPWRVDIVNWERDCCLNPTLCHIKHQPGVRKPVRLTKLDEITSAIRSAEREGDEDAIVESATRQVEIITRRYAALLQPDIERYKDWIREKLEVGGLFDTTPLLNDNMRETLALARFLWEQVEAIKSENFAGSALLLTGVLEQVTVKTLFKRSRTFLKADGTRLPETLGTLASCKDFGGDNWVLLRQQIVDAGYWEEGVAPGAVYPLSRWVDSLKPIQQIRNRAAHKGRIERADFQTITTGYFGSSLTGLGVLNGLLMAWRSTPVPPGQR